MEQPKSKRLRAEAQADDASSNTVAHLVLSRAHTDFAALSHVAQNVDACVGCTSKWTLETAAKAGLVRLMDKLLAKEWAGVCDDFREARFLHGIRQAARAGNTDVLHWWRTKYMPNDPDVAGPIIRIAALKGFLHVLQWLYEVDGHVRAIARMKTPIVCSRPEIVRWVNEHRSHIEMTVYVERAAARGDLAFLEWAKTQSNLSLVYNGAFEAAAEAGHLEVMKHVMEQQPVDDVRRAYLLAAFNDHLPVIQWLLRDHGHLENISAMDWERMDAHLPMIKWFLERYQWRDLGIRDEWLFLALEKAAQFGSTDILEYILDHHRPGHLHLNVLDSGVASGKIEIVEWLQVRGIGSYKDLLLVAMEKADLEMVKWVQQNYAPESCSRDTLTHAVHKGLEAVKWFHENRKDEGTTQAMDHAAALGHLEIVKFLHENRSEGCTWRAMSGAAAYGLLEIVKFLHANRSEGEIPSAMDFAIIGDQLEIVQWLYETNPGKCDRMKALHAVLYSNGRRDIAAYLIPRINPNYGYLFRQGTECGHFDLMEWVMQTCVHPLDMQDVKDLRLFHDMLSRKYCPMWVMYERDGEHDQVIEEDFFSVGLGHAVG